MQEHPPIQPAYDELANPCKCCPSGIHDRPQLGPLITYGEWSRLLDQHYICFANDVRIEVRRVLYIEDERVPVMPGEVH